MIHIACCIDDKFTFQCGALLKSICENKQSESINFHILTDNIEVFNENILKDIVLQYSQSITIYRVNKEELNNCPIRERDHVSIVTYFRILIPEIIHQSIHKILYLDCDIIVLDDLLELWNTDITNKAVGVVPEAVNHDIRIYNRLEYEMEWGYFNAGVLLINLDYWRKHNLTSEILDYINKNPNKLKFWDQDALNYVLKDKKVNMPLHYNVQDGFYWQDPFFAKKDWKEMYEAAKNPTILHYTGPIKPWYKECTHPKKDLYLKYSKLLHLKNNKIKHIKFRLRIKFLIINILTKTKMISNHSVYR